MNSLVYWLTLLILLVGVLACDVASLASTPLPTSTTDRIATRVAGTETAVAEETAVAATVVAKLPKVTQVPTSAKTPESTLTSLTPLLTPTTYVPHATPTPSITRVPTSTGDKLVLGKEYGIKVYAFKRKKISNENRQSPAGYTFLQIGAMFFKRGTEWKDYKGSIEASLLSVVDAKGEVFKKPESIWGLVYDPNFRSEEIEGWTQGRSIDTYGIIAIFLMPDSSTGLKLQYRDLPLIDLEPIRYLPDG
jgi:hypothetical protein